MESGKEEQRMGDKVENHVPSLWLSSSFYKYNNNYIIKENLLQNTNVLVLYVEMFSFWRRHDACRDREKPANMFVFMKTWFESNL